MKQAILFLLGAFLIVNQTIAQNTSPQKKWGLAWDMPNKWTKSSQGADGLLFVSPNENANFVIKVFTAKDAKAQEEAFTKVLSEQQGGVDVDAAAIMKETRKGTLAGISATIYEDLEEPDEEDDDEEEEPEGSWLKIYGFEHQGKYIVISMAEDFGRKRKMTKTFDDIVKSIKKSK